MKRCATIIFVGLFLLLPGCGGRVYDWTLDHFYQGETIKLSINEVKNYLRPLRIYDQFTLVGCFSILWLSDAVRSLYTNIFAFVHAKNQDEKMAFLRRQLAENEHFISFYILACDDVSFGDSEAKWQVFLRINNKLYNPLSITKVDLNNEQKLLFGKLYNRFVVPYLVQFSAKNIDGIPLLIPGDDLIITLEFRSLHKVACVSWNVINGSVPVVKHYCRVT